MLSEASVTGSGDVAVQPVVEDPGTDELALSLCLTTTDADGGDLVAVEVASSACLELSLTASGDLVFNMAGVTSPLTVNGVNLNDGVEHSVTVSVGSSDVLVFVDGVEAGSFPGAVVGDVTQCYDGPVYVGGALAC